MKKVIRDGKVAVIYSPGYGAGWSTWNDDEDRDWLLFHPELVKAVDENKSCEEIIELVEKLKLDFGHSEDDYVCSIGASKLMIAWIPLGAIFYIEEYDGSERVVCGGSFNQA